MQDKKAEIPNHAFIVPDSFKSIDFFTFGQQSFIGCAGVVLALYYVIEEYMSEHSKRQDFFFQNGKKCRHPTKAFDTKVLSLWASLVEGPHTDPARLMRRASASLAVPLNADASTTPAHPTARFLNLPLNADGSAAPTCPLFAAISAPTLLRRDTFDNSEASFGFDSERALFELVSQVIDFAEFDVAQELLGAGAGGKVKRREYSYIVLIHCTHTLCSYTILIHCAHTLYSSYPYPISYPILISCTRAR
jgi:hypothetical protein